MSEQPEWLAALDLPDEIKNNATIQQSPDLNHALNRVVEMRKAQSNSIALPGEDQESKDKFASRAKEYGLVPKGESEQAPDTSEGYDVEFMPVEDARAEVLNKRLEAMRTNLHEQGVGKVTAERQLKAMAEGFKADHDALTASSNASLETLRQDWGPDFDANYANAAKASEYLGGINGIMLASGEVVPVETNKEFMNMLSNVGSNMGEDGQNMGGGNKPEPVDVAAIKRDMSVLDKKMGELKSGDPERDVLAHERFGLLKKVMVADTGDKSILGLSEVEIGARLAKSGR